jgi:hypothetical protein
MVLDRRECLGEARLDRSRQVIAELLELVQALLEILALRRQLLQPLLLRFVLLFRERIHLPERLTPALAANQPLGQLVAVLAFGRLCRCRGQPPPRFICLGAHTRQLDVDRADSLGGLARPGAQLYLLGTEAPQLGPELRRASRLRLGTLPSWGLVPLDTHGERSLEPLSARQQLGEHRLARPSSRPRIGFCQSSCRRACPIGAGLRGDAGFAGPGGDGFGFGAELAGVTGSFDYPTVRQPLGGHSACVNLGHRAAQLALA